MWSGSRSVIPSCNLLIATRYNQGQFSEIAGNFQQLQKYKANKIYQNIYKKGPKTSVFSGLSIGAQQDSKYSKKPLINNQLIFEKNYHTNKSTNISYGLH